MVFKKNISSLNVWSENLDLLVNCNPDYDMIYGCIPIWATLNTYTNYYMRPIHYFFFSKKISTLICTVGVHLQTISNMFYKTWLTNFVDNHKNRR